MHKMNVMKLKKNTIILLILILSCIPAFPNQDIILKEKNTPKSSSVSGSTTSPINVTENTTVNLGKIDTQIDPSLSVFFNGWESENFNISVENIEEKDSSTTIKQEENANEDFFQIYGFDGSSDGFPKIKPQEIGSSFNLPKKSHLSNISLMIGWDNMVTSGFDEYDWMIKNTTIEIRNNNNQYPEKDTNIISVPLTSARVLSNYKQSGESYEELNGKNLGYVIENYELEGMMDKTEIEIPLNIDLNIGTYWVIVNASKVIIEDWTLGDDPQIFTKVFFYDDGNDFNYVNKSYDNNFYSIDNTEYISNSNYDMFLKIKSRVLNYSDPTEVSLEIDSNAVDSQGKVSVEKQVSDFTSFTYSSTPDTDFNATIHGKLTKSSEVSVDTAYTLYENDVEWTGTIDLTEAAGQLDRNAIIEFPSEWNMGTLDFSEAVGYSIDGQSAILSDTMGYDTITFTINSTNCLTDVQNIPLTINHTQTLSPLWIGTGTGNYLDIELWCNGSLVETIASGRSITSTSHYIYERYDNGTGYTLRGYFENPTEVGYMESSEFTILQNPEPAPEPPETVYVFGDAYIEFLFNDDEVIKDIGYVTIENNTFSKTIYPLSTGGTNVFDITNGTYNITFEYHGDEYYVENVDIQFEDGYVRVTLSTEIEKLTDTEDPTEEDPTDGETDDTIGDEFGVDGFPIGITFVMGVGIIGIILKKRT